MPSLLTIEGGERGTPHGTRMVEVVSYEEAFKRELFELDDAIRTGRQPRTNAIDGLHDVALCHAVARSAITGRPVDLPSALPDWAGDDGARMSAGQAAAGQAAADDGADRAGMAVLT
jgi:hypothetical protein